MHVWSGEINSKTSIVAIEEFRSRVARRHARPMRLCNRQAVEATRRPRLAIRPNVRQGRPLRPTDPITSHDLHRPAARKCHGESSDRRRATLKRARIRAGIAVRTPRKPRRPRKPRKHRQNEREWQALPLSGATPLRTAIPPRWQDPARAFRPLPLQLVEFVGNSHPPGPRRARCAELILLDPVRRIGTV